MQKLKTMSFTNFIPLACKKLRRSIRILHREKDDHRYKRIEMGLLGYFELLPIEILDKMFSYLSVDDLSVLSICSKTIRNQIEVYVHSPYGLQQLMPSVLLNNSESLITSDVQNKNIKHFQKLGLLLKRSTCLYPTKERIKLVLQFASKTVGCALDKEASLIRVLLKVLEHCVLQTEDELVWLECNPYGCTKNMTHILQCYGIFIHTVIAGWDESECQFVHSVLENVSHMKKYSLSVLSSFPGSHPQQETFVRMYYRLVYLDYCWNVSDRYFWLSRILKSRPIVHQAKLLFLLYGPICAEKILWYELIENVPTNFAQANKNLIDLAHVIRFMQQNTAEWTGDDIISILEELTNTPEEWLLENIATLLLLCGNIITAMHMANKLLSGKMMELANLVTYLALVCTKYGHHHKWLVQLIDNVCQVTENETDRQKFIQMIPLAFQEIMMDYNDISELLIEEERDSDLRMLVESQNSFLSVIISRAFCSSVSSSFKLLPEE